MRGTSHRQQHRQEHDSRRYRSLEDIDGGSIASHMELKGTTKGLTATETWYWGKAMREWKTETGIFQRFQCVVEIFVVVKCGEKYLNLSSPGRHAFFQWEPQKVVESATKIKRWERSQKSTFRKKTKEKLGWCKLKNDVERLKSYLRRSCTSHN